MIDKMNILVLHEYFLEEDDPGGSRWNELTRNWTECGHNVMVLAGMIHANGSEKKAEYKGHYFKKKQQGKVTVWRCHVSEAYNKNFAGRFWGYFSFMFSSIWAGLFKAKGKFDVVIVTSPPLFVGFSGYIISRIKRIPFVFEVRDLWPESAIDTGVLTNKFIIRTAYWFEAFIYKKAKLFNLSEQLLNNFDREAFRKENGFHNKFVITYVGAHGVANHLEQLLDAGKLLEDTNVLFLLIGQGMEKEKIKELYQKMKVINVRFIDPVPKKEVFKYIIASEMGASVLKKVDTFKTIYSNKTFDYMSCKKPILMAIYGVSRELVEQAKCGSFVEPENKEDYNRIIREYLFDTKRIETEGFNVYNYAKNTFDRQVLGARYVKYIYTAIVK